MFIPSCDNKTVSFIAFCRIVHDIIYIYCSLSETMCRKMSFPLQIFTQYENSHKNDIYIFKTTSQVKTSSNPLRNMSRIRLTYFIKQTDGY